MRLEISRRKLARHALGQFQDRNVRFCDGRAPKAFRNLHLDAAFHYWTHVVRLQNLQSIDTLANRVPVLRPVFDHADEIVAIVVLPKNERARIKFVTTFSMEINAKMRMYQGWPLQPPSEN